MLRLIGLGFCLLLAGTQDPADKVKTLIEKLGSDELAVREEATKELMRIGYPALPALRQASAPATGEMKKLLVRVIDRLTAFGAPVLVTLVAADRPLREIVADLEQRTRIPFHLVGAAAEAKATVSAKNVVVWKVVEDICRARGDLMYRFDTTGIEIYPSKFRDLPTVDREGFRFFIDRFIWDGRPSGNSSFRMLGGVLAPAGAQVILIEFKVEHMLDDQGIDIAQIPDGFRGGISDDHEQQVPTQRKFLYPLGYLPDSREVPSPAATKLARCSGKVVVWLAGGERVLASIPGPFEKPGVAARAELAALGITRWKWFEGRVHMRVTASWNKPSVDFLDHRLSPYVKLRLKDGSRMSGVGWHSFPGISTNEIKREDRIVAFEVPEVAVATAFDLVAPDPVVTIEMPFDFRDIPLNADVERKKGELPSGPAAGRVGHRWRKVIDFSGSPSWVAVLGFSKYDWPEKDAVMWKDLKALEIEGRDGQAFTQAPPEDTAIPGFDITSPTGAPGPLEIAVKVPQEGELTISKLRLSMVARVPRGRRSYLLADFDSPEKMKAEDDLFQVSIRDGDEWQGCNPEIEVRPKETPHSELAGIWCTVLYKFDTVYAPGAGEIILTGKGESTIGRTPYGSLRPMVMEGGEKMRRLLRCEVIIPVGLKDRPASVEYRDIPLR